MLYTNFLLEIENAEIVTDIQGSVPLILYS